MLLLLPPQPLLLMEVLFAFAEGKENRTDGRRRIWGSCESASEGAS